MYILFDLFIQKSNVRQLNFSYNCSSYFDNLDLPSTNGNSYINTYILIVIRYFIVLGSHILVAVMIIYKCKERIFKTTT